MDNKAFDNYVKQKGWDKRYKGYNQTPIENLIESRKKIYEEYKKRKKEQEESKALEEYIEKELEKIVEKEFDKLFKGLQK